ncbi:MAG TPA: ComEC/Rec2 family competence protein, partial [Sphaerochaeta sp.]|nr:ComEC/Rec2 family competence protein [Sphaerochaeta sp.]
MRGQFWVCLGIVIGVPLLFFLAATGSFLLAYPLAVATALLLFCFLLSLYYPNLRRTIILISTFFYFCYSLFGWAMAANHGEMAFIPIRITEVRGVLIEDSLLSSSGKQLLRLRLELCRTRDGAEGSAKGVLAALVKTDDFLISGSRLTMQGELAPDGSLFLADTVQLLSISRVRVFRRKLLSLIERRFAALIDNEESCSLALMLLLGRSGDAAFPLKELSLSSGCAHLLALSGMHLQFFIALFSYVCVPLLGKRRARIVSVLLAVLYVLLVGPKPSLVRAMGMAIVSLFLRGKMASYYSFLLTACIQVVVFPSALSSMGSLFSYAAYGGLLCNRLFFFYRPRWMEPLFASIYAILFTAIP